MFELTLFRILTRFLLNLKSLILSPAFSRCSLIIFKNSELAAKISVLAFFEFVGSEAKKRFIVMLWRVRVVINYLKQ